MLKFELGQIDSRYNRSYRTIDLNLNILDDRSYPDFDIQFPLFKMKCTKMVD